LITSSNFVGCSTASNRLLLATISGHRAYPLELTSTWLWIKFIKNPTEFVRRPMPSAKRKYEVVSVSLPQDLVKRANTVIPKARRSRIIRNMLEAFLDSVSRKQMEREYARYYAQRTHREAQDERDMLNDWRLSDDEAWAILEKEESSGRRKAR